MADLRPGRIPPLAALAMLAPDARRRALLVLLAFAAVYLIWGSTYLAIRWTIDSIPPLLSAGARFLVAGALLYAVLRWRGEARPARIHWRGAALIGGLLLLGGNGGVVFAQQWVASGLTALLIAVVPSWVVLLETFALRTGRPPWATIAGVAMGFGGVVLLVTQGGEAPLHAFGAGLILLATISWAIGSVLTSKVRLPDSPLMATSMEMLAGGALLTLVATLRGEWGMLDVGAISAGSALAWAYLVVFGSIVAFSGYVFLLRAVAPEKAATYAYVNPLIAVALGAALAAEPITPWTLAAAAAILGGTALVTLTKGRARPARRSAEGQAHGREAEAWTTTTSGST